MRGVILLAAFLGAAAMWPFSSLGRQAAEDALRRAAEAVERADAAQAVGLLAGVFAQDPAYFSETLGAAAFWLGRAHAERAEADEAARVWAEGFSALAGDGILDLRLADALVGGVYEAQQHQHYEAAAQAYLLLLRFLEAARTDEERALVDAHLQALAFILPPSLQQQTGVAPPEEPGASLRPKPGAGPLLERWWRSQDVLPATRRNERLDEHLERVAYAERHFSPGGVFDDRAAVYIRLGPPKKKTRVDFTSIRFQEKVLQRVPTITSADFPRNAFWLYDNVDREAQYLFVERDSRFVLVESANELLPPAIRRGVSRSERGAARAQALARTMEEVFRELALFHPVYAVRYNDVSNFVTLLDQEEIVQDAEAHRRELERQAQSDDQRENDERSDRASAMRPGGGLSSVLTDHPYTFVQGLMTRSKNEDYRAVERREERVPRSYTNLLEEVDPLPVVVRTARFLDDDGTTRTEVYWSAPAESLAPTRDMEKRLAEEGYRASERSLVLVSLVQKSADYHDRAVHYKRHLLDHAASGGRNDVLTPQLYTLRGDTDTYHLAFEWDQYAAVMGSRQDTPAGLGPRLRIHTHRADTLTALSGTPGVLEMSDLKPLLLDRDGWVPEDAGVLNRQATPYPYDRLTPETQMAVYFEVYHLAYGPDDRTRYAVSYEVARVEERGLRTLFRDRLERTAGRTERQGDRRNVAEYILLDPSQWAEAQKVVVTVRVHDAVTGQEKARSLSFDVAK